MLSHLKVSMLAFITTIIVMLAFSVSAEVSGYSMVEVYPDGLTVVKYNLTVTVVPSRVSITAPPQALFVSIYVDGEPVAYDYNPVNGSLSFTATSSRVHVRVYTQALTSKEGLVWRFTWGPLEYTTLIALPKDSVIVNVEPRQYNVRIADGRLYLEFNPGSRVSIEYIVVPAATTPQYTPTPPTVTTPATLTPTQTPPPQEEREKLPLWAIVLAIALIGAAALIVATLAFKRRAPASALLEVESEALDERDRQIIETLRSHRELTASEIMRITGIPKTPLYRKLEKLEKLGLITSTLKAGVRVYKLKETK